jgi:flavin-dependent dehydrogenase
VSGILVAGGGLAGAAVAIALAQAGERVTVIERDAEPAHKICGEFLSAEASGYLQKLGLDPASLGGHEISRLRLVRGGDAVAADLPFTGTGLSRKKLDAALLDHASACGAVVMRGRFIRHIETADGIAVAVDGQGTVHPDALFLATGKHELRGAKRAATAPAPLVGFKMYFRLTRQQTAALAGHVELIMFGQGYAGLQLVEDGQANFCALIHRDRLAQAGNFQTLLADLSAESPHLAARLAGATPLLEAPLTIARVPYGFVHRPHPADTAPVYRLGDQAGVIQSFTGDGMSIALHSAALAAQMLLAGKDAASFHRRLAGDITGQIRRAGAIFGVMNAPLAQPALFGLARAVPASLGLAARFTRVPATARLY